MGTVSTSTKQVAVDWVRENEKLLIDVHDRIWQWAEVGLQEFKTGKLLADILEENGFEVERGVAGDALGFRRHLWLWKARHWHHGRVGCPSRDLTEGGTL